MNTKEIHESEENKALFIEGKEIFLDEEGFLLDPDEWKEVTAETMARNAGLNELSELHWRIINFIREFYLANGKAPLNRDLKNGTGFSLMEIEARFPGGIKRGARRFAGLPNPKSC